MTKIIIEQITKLKDIALFSKAFKEGMIYINVTKVAKHLNKDRETVKRDCHYHLVQLDYYTVFLSIFLRIATRLKSRT